MVVGVASRASYYSYGGTHPPGAFCMGPDGRIWVGETLQFVSAVAVGSPFPAVITTEYNPYSGIQQIGAVATDGTYLYFLDTLTIPCKVYKVDTSGVGHGSFSTPIAITSASDMCYGPDGNLWITSTITGDGVYKMTPGGAFTHYALASAELERIVSDGTNLWAADINGAGSHVGVWKITTGGVGTFYADSTTDLFGLCWDGTDLWGCGSDYYCKITTGGVFTWFNVPGITGTDIQVNADAGGFAIANHVRGASGWVEADNAGNATVWGLNLGSVTATYTNRILANPPDGRIWVLWEYSGIGDIARVVGGNALLMV